MFETANVTRKPTRAADLTEGKVKQNEPCTSWPLAQVNINVSVVSPSRIETDLREMIKIKKSLGEIVSMVKKRRRICCSIKQIVDPMNRLHAL